MGADPTEIAELAGHECLALLRSADVGRLAVSRPGHPEVFPVNFVVDHGTVLFRTAAGTKLEALALDHAVTFEADGYDPSTGEAWSVVVKGQAAEVVGGHDLVDVAELPIFPWHATPKQRIVQIVPEEVTGRRFRATRHTAPP